MEEESSKEEEQKEHPRKTAGPLSALTFWWLVPFFWRGYRMEYLETDVFKVLNSHESKQTADRLERAWQKERRRRPDAPSLARALFIVYGPRIGLYGLCFGLLELGIKMVQPVAIGYLVNFYGSDEDQKDLTYTYAGLIIGSACLSLLVYYPALMGLCHSALKIKVGLAALVYRKSLRLSASSLSSVGGDGHAVNLLTGDVARIDLAVLFLHNLWLGPMVTAAAAYIMYREMGVAAMAGVVLILLFIPFQGWLTKLSAGIHKRAAGKTDKRLSLMNELVRTIHLVKMRAFETELACLLTAVRKLELRLLQNSSYIRGVHIAFTVFRTRTAVFASVVTYVLLGGTLTAARVFVVAAAFNTMKRTMTDFFSYAIENMTLARVTVRRVQHFLLLENSPAIKEEDQLPKNVRRNNKNKYIINGTNNFKERTFGIELVEATASWENFQLKDINMKVSPGSLTAVVGAVGCGKSCLLQVLLGEMSLSKGERMSEGRFSYAAQEPWLFNRSVRRNIVMGERWDLHRYKRILQACSLHEDLATMRLGDGTTAGERGRALSGGQRARVGLARALYRRADIYLLDEPLGALDGHVAMRVMRGIRLLMAETKAACVLVTHQHQLLKTTDQVMLLHAGQIIQQGTYEELREHININTEQGTVNREVKEEVIDTPAEQKEVKKGANESGYSVKREGGVHWEVFREYIRAYGPPWVPLGVFLLFLLGQISASASDYFIGHWVNLEQARHPNHSFGETEAKTWSSVQNTYVLIYATVNLLTVALTIAASFLFFAMSIRASGHLHTGMLEAVLHAPMKFFEQNPAGQVLNRFSRDLHIVDEVIPSAGINCVQTTLSILGVLAVVSVVQPWLVVPSFAALLILLGLRRVYIAVNTNLRRLEANTRAPMLSHCSASLQGLVTVRAHGLAKRLESEFDHLQNSHSTARYLVQAAARMFALWLETACVVLLVCAVGGFLVPNSEKYGGNVGLAITQLMGMMGLVQWAVRQSSELEANMTAVERALDYCRIVPESAEEPLITVPEDWPKGEVRFIEVSLQYARTGEQALFSINFQAAAGEKLGIIGRTGAGKSSLVNALLQLYKTEGTIQVDGLDISHVKLSELRSRVAVVPQEAAMETCSGGGSLRYWLDPGGEHDDDRLWRVLEEVDLRKTVRDLDEPADEKLLTWSCGQRQLLWLARALLAGSHILVLDEATASLDAQTDTLLQEVLRRRFADCTVLTIAHRLRSVMWCDRVLVLEQGRVKECGRPKDLLTDAGSYLSTLLQEMPSTAADELRAIAHH